MSDWNIWDGKTPAKTEDIKRWLAQSPPWRRASGEKHKSKPASAPLLEGADLRRGETWHAPAEGDVLRKIHLSMWLRRPLLIEGDPGVGKSSLAYALAHGLGLGKVLRWEISSKTPYSEGLYQYNAVSHLRGIQDPDEDSAIENYVQLGPLGTALIGSKVKGQKDLLPRVLLVDELDKSDYDLPNDLLHVLEEAKFTIDELNRGEDEKHWIAMDDGRQVEITGGRVTCNVHPVVVITSNGERQFPAAFLRRCVRIRLQAPRGEQLRSLVAEHFKGEDYTPDVGELDSGKISPDRVIQALFMKELKMDPSEVLESLGGDGRN